MEGRERKGVSWGQRSRECAHQEGRGGPGAVPVMGTVLTFLPAPRDCPLPRPGRRERRPQPPVLCRQLRVGPRPGSHCVLSFTGGCRGPCLGSGAQPGTRGPSSCWKQQMVPLARSLPAAEAHLGKEGKWMGRTNKTKDEYDFVFK